MFLFGILLYQRKYNGAVLIRQRCHFIKNFDLYKSYNQVFALKSGLLGKKVESAVLIKSAILRRYSTEYIFGLHMSMTIKNKQNRVPNKKQQFGRVDSDE